MNRVGAAICACVAGLLLCTGRAEAADITLQWDANSEPDLAGYRVYFGIAQGVYTNTSGAGNVTTFTVAGLTAGQNYCFAATAYDTYGSESGYSNEVCAVAPGTAESVSAPDTPAGPVSVGAGVIQTFSAGRATSSTGDVLQYRFIWGDGTDSGWLPVGTLQAAKSWGVAGSYAVTAEARCATHTSVVSSSSPVLNVTVSGAAQETIAAPTAPGGPESGAIGTACTFTAAGASSSLGHAVEYRFHWGDGTDSGWRGPGVVSATKTWSFPATYSVRAEARCATHTAETSSLSPARQVVVSDGVREAVTAPSAPSGPTAGHTGAAYIFTTGGAVSNSGDQLEYRIHWGDGTVSDWSSAVATAPCRLWKSWRLAGAYTVWAEARCLTHPDVKAASAGIKVSIAKSDPRLFVDAFSHGAAKADPDWRMVSGAWSLRSGAYAATSLAKTNLAVVRALPALLSGRLQASLRQTQLSAAAPSGGVVFAFRDPRHYRYATILGSRLVIGQVGASASEKAGVKASARGSFTVGRWQRLRVDLRLDGLVSVYVGKSTKPLAAYRFKDRVAGGAGCIAFRSQVFFDNYAVWDDSVLP